WRRRGGLAAPAQPDPRERAYAPPRSQTRRRGYAGFGGDGRNRTDDEGFADLCLTTWLRRRCIHEAHRGADAATHRRLKNTGAASGQSLQQVRILSNASFGAITRQAADVCGVPSEPGSGGMTNATSR